MPVSSVLSDSCQAMLAIDWRIDEIDIPPLRRRRRRPATRMRKYQSEVVARKIDKLTFFFRRQLKVAGIELSECW